jgi:Ca2+-binding RTX toxin-like protein
MQNLARLSATVAAATAAIWIFAAGALAAVTPTRDAATVATALTDEATAPAITGAEFVALPPNGNPAAIGDSDLATFPLKSDTFGVLSSGNAALADQPNTSTESGAANGGTNAGHGQVQDVVTLKIDMVVPEIANCLTVDFRFLSEEFPEYIGSQFNDGFVAELDRTTFQVAGPGTVTAPDNVATDENGKVPTVNTSGTSSDNALGTTYDGATPILRATTQVTPGPHSLYLSVYDASDGIYDSAVFIDNLQLRFEPAVLCTKGAAPTPEIGGQCQGEVPTVIASDGVATGTPNADVILGSKANDRIRGRGGDDIICGRGGKDDIEGGAGDDTIQGNNGRDEISGRSGNDDLRGNKRADVLRGNGGDDLLRGKRGGDELYGGPGDDECLGGKGDDQRFNCES